MISTSLSSQNVSVIFSQDSPTSDYHSYSSDDNSRLIGSVVLEESKLCTLLTVWREDRKENDPYGYVNTRFLTIKKMLDKSIQEKINLELSKVYDRYWSDIQIVEGRPSGRAITSFCELNESKFASFLVEQFYYAPDLTSSMHLTGLTFDLSTGNKLKLSSIIDPEHFKNISVKVIKAVKDEIKRNETSDYQFYFFNSEAKEEEWVNHDDWLKNFRISNKTCFTLSNKYLNLYFPYSKGHIVGNIMIVQIQFEELKNFAPDYSPVKYFTNLNSVWGKIKAGIGPIWFDATKNAIEDYVQKENSPFYTLNELPDTCKYRIAQLFPGEQFENVKIYRSIPLNSLKSKIGLINTITDYLGGVAPSAQTFNNNIYFESFQLDNPEDEQTLIHELMHVLQYKSLGYIGFRDEYLKSISAGLSYYQIPLEIEAFNRANIK